MSSEQKEKSTPRPWTLRSSGIIMRDEGGSNVKFVARLEHFDEQGWADGALIVTAVNERDQLLSSLAEKQEEIKRSHKVLLSVRKWLIYRTDDNGTEYTVWPERIAEIDAALNPISEPQEHK